MSFVLLDLAAAIVLLASIAVASTRGCRVRSHRLRSLGCALVAVPLPLAVALNLALRVPAPADQVSFLLGVAAFAVGAALILRSDEGDWGREAEDDSPPWWPAFEREFRVYARTSPPRRGKVPT